VRVDMESSKYTEFTVNLIKQVFPEHPNTGTVIQSYLRRSVDDIHLMIESGIRVRLVKGAYMEPKSVAFQKKSDVDKNYLDICKLLLQQGNYPGIATHDEKIIKKIVDFCQEFNIEPSSF